MRTTIRLDDDLRQQVQKRKRVRVPTSGGSGLQPGVNLDSNAAVRDLMDGIE